MRSRQVLRCGSGPESLTCPIVTSYKIYLFFLDRRFEVVSDDNSSPYTYKYTYSTVSLCSKSAKLHLCSSLSCTMTVAFIQLLNGQKRKLDAVIDTRLISSLI